MKLLLLALILSIGCKKHPVPPAISLDDRLKAKYDLYLKLLSEEGDDVGAINSRDCDSLLFNSLYAASGGPVQIDAFRTGNKWYRTHFKNCYDGGGSSDISRDMLLGLYYPILRYKRKVLAVGLIEYAEDNGFVMGRGDVFRTHMTTNMLGLLGRLTNKLGHWNKYKFYPVFYAAGLDGYQAHLQVLGITLYWKMHGYIYTNHKSRIIEHYKSNPKNGFFAWAYGTMVDPTKLKDVLPILMNEKYFPSDKLPSSKNYCGNYLWEKRLGKKDWDPCTKGKEHREYHGIDFLFVAALYLGIL